MYINKSLKKFTEFHDERLHIALYSRHIICDNKTALI